MLSELKLTDDEIDAAARHILSCVSPTSHEVGVKLFQEARHAVITTAKVMSAIATVVDRRKEK
jgi:hypothetical protein